MPTRCAPLMRCTWSRVFSTSRGHTKVAVSAPGGTRGAGVWWRVWRARHGRLGSQWASCDSRDNTVPLQHVRGGPGARASAAAATRVTPPQCCPRAGAGRRLRGCGSWRPLCGACGRCVRRRRDATACRGSAGAAPHCTCYRSCHAILHRRILRVGGGGGAQRSPGNGRPSNPGACGRPPTCSQLMMGPLPPQRLAPRIAGAAEADDHRDLLSALPSSLCAVVRVSTVTCDACNLTRPPAVGTLVACTVASRSPRRDPMHTSRTCAGPPT